MKKYLIFNFKNNPVSLKDLEKLIKIYESYLPLLSDHYQIILIPPDLYLLSLQQKLKNKNFYLKNKIFYGIQNFFWLDKITLTGEITPKMVLSLKVKFIIVGHSERKIYLKEDYNIINNKIKAALAHKLVPIICVGEKEKKEDIDFSIKEEIFDELNYSFRGINLKDDDKIIIAYEPYWAVNSGVMPSLEKIEKIGELIRFWLSRRFGEEKGRKIPVLYGGSVEAKNINEILSLKLISGVLIGKKSGKPKQIEKILNRISNYNK
jgi:triosephosphate isomerase